MPRKPAKQPAARTPGGKPYFQAVADARYVIRRVLRLVDECAKKHDLDSLEHQALIQIYGARTAELSIGEVAERLFISPAFGSRIVKALIAKGFVETHPSKNDLRVVHLATTAAGTGVLASIDAEVRLHVDYFTRQLSAEQKDAAIAIFAFYVGTSVHINGHSASMEGALLDVLGPA